MPVTQRFLHYISFDTTSDENSDSVPSTPGQSVLGQALAHELAALGMENAHMDSRGYVYATLPATPGYVGEALGLIAHMDTSPSAKGKNIHPAIVRYNGGDIPLGDGTVVTRAADFPALQQCIGQELIVTDGTTLLGADDKAGIAEIVTACAYLLAHPQLPHRTIAVCFTPDEEIGRGSDYFDPAVFPARQAYTVDGGELGELSYENFNAASATLRVRGVSIHPGEAKGKMKNAILMAHDFLSLLPPAQAPAHTEGYEGFYHVCGIQGDESLTTLQLLIRDHDRQSFEQRKLFLRRSADYLNEVWGNGSFTLRITDSYYNMSDALRSHMALIDNAKAAMLACGVTPLLRPIRGGTDGARLTYEGLPCPNLSTGGMNFHGVHECIPIPAMEKMVQVLIALAR